MTMNNSEIEMFAKVTVEEFEDEFLAQEEFLRKEREEEGEGELTDMSVTELMPNVRSFCTVSKTLRTEMIASNGLVNH